MLKTAMTAALVLALSLTAAGCGTADNASTAAHRWGDKNIETRTQQEAGRGTRDGRNTDGAYSADRDGRVDGYTSDSADGSRTNLGDGLEDAGEDLARGAKGAVRGVGDAARGVGDAVEDTLDGITGTDKNTAARRNGTDTNEATKNANITPGNSLNPSLK